MRNRINNKRHRCCILTKTEKLPIDVNENLMYGDNGIYFVSGLIKDINELTNHLYSDKDIHGKVIDFDEIQKMYLKNIYRSLLRRLNNVKKEYINLPISTSLR